MDSVDILLIEDNIVDCRLTEQIFARMSGDVTYNLAWTGSYEEGLEEIKKQAHSLYLVDFSLGAKDGLELIREALSYGCDGPFILLTGMDNESIYSESADVGVYDYILKDEMSPSNVQRSLTYALERRAAENKLRAQKEFNEFIMEQLPLMVVSILADNTISFANPEAVSVFGVSELELLGQPFSILFNEVDSLRFEETLKVGRREFDFLSEIQNKEGEKRIIRWHVMKSSQMLGQDQVQCILAGKDVTHIHEAELRERQRDKMESLGHLAGGVAHELNNLFQPILLAGEMIRDASDDEQILRHADKVIRNSVMAGKIVDDILAFSRPESKSRDYIAIGEVMEESLKLVQDLVPKDIALKVTENGVFEDRYIHVNKSDLGRVLKNFILNAAQAMDQDGEIVIHQSIEQIENCDNAYDLAEGEYFRIDVVDQGHGISRAHLDIIFNPFFTTKDIGQGTGLGLAICFNIVQSWKGTIKVKSQEGKGSTFSVFIPVSEKNK